MIINCGGSVAKIDDVCSGEIGKVDVQSYTHTPSTHASIVAQATDQADSHDDVRRLREHGDHESAEAKAVDAGREVGRVRRRSLRCGECRRYTSDEPRRTVIDQHYSRSVPYEALLVQDLRLFPVKMFEYGF